MNEYTPENLILSSNELAFGSHVFNTDWIYMRYSATEYKNQDEIIIQNERIDWSLHSIYRNGGFVEVLMGLKNITPEVIEEIVQQTKPIEIRKLKMEEIVAKINKLHTECYKEETGQKLEGKGSSEAQQIIADFLDLLSAGGIYGLPEHGNNGKNIELGQEKNKTKSIEDVCKKANTLTKRIKEIEPEYDKKTKKENMGYIFDKLK